MTVNTAATPLIAELSAYKETTWFNPDLATGDEALASCPLKIADIDAAAARMRRFAPYLARVFPDTRSLDGIIESPLVAVPAMKGALAAQAEHRIPGRLWAKLDSHLPVSGSIKARGGIYEVLVQAERIATAAGLLEEDYLILDSPEARDLFALHTIAVGSTGNLGLAIGIASARLGFRAQVHMSADARQWKKDLLRSHGVEVIEYDGDYSSAVAQGRAAAEADATTYFVDDENSTTLFAGYAVAARRLAGQLQAADVTVDADHPLFAYLPCGVGGGPGGVAFGLKTVFHDAVHAFFAEPTHAPCMTLGMATGRHETIGVADIGLDAVTAADGLAVGRASGFVGRALARAIDGCFTVSDESMFRMLALLQRTEQLQIEPSATAGFAGPARITAATDYLEGLGIGPDQLAHSTHIAWVTGGSMVPEAEMFTYLNRGMALLDSQ